MWTREHKEQIMVEVRTDSSSCSQTPINNKQIRIRIIWEWCKIIIIHLDWYLISIMPPGMRGTLSNTIIISFSFKNISFIFERTKEYYKLSIKKIYQLWQIINVYKNNCKSPAVYRVQPSGGGCHPGGVPGGNGCHPGGPQGRPGSNYTSLAPYKCTNGKLKECLLCCKCWDIGPMNAEATFLVISYIKNNVY